MATVHSMTGFASARGVCPLGAVTVEIRCVNSRFLDLSVKFPDELRLSEPALREILSKNIGRGKCECRLSLKADPEAAPARLRKESLAALKALQTEVLALEPDAKPLTVSQKFSSIQGSSMPRRLTSRSWMPRLSMSSRKHLRALPQAASVKALRLKPFFSATATKSKRSPGTSPRACRTSWPM